MAVEIASALKKVREDAGLTQIELAEALGVTQSTISNVEVGRRQPSIDLLERWLDRCHGTLSILTAQLDAVDRAARLLRELDVADAELLATIVTALRRHPASTKKGVVIRGTLDFVASTAETTGE